MNIMIFSEQDKWRMEFLDHEGYEMNLEIALVHFLSSLIKLPLLPPTSPMSPAPLNSAS